MDLVFVAKPLLALAVFVPMLILHAVAYIMRDHKFSLFAEFLNIAFHSGAIVAIWLLGGGYEDTLVFVLLSALIALLRYRPAKRQGKKEGNAK